MKVLVLLSIFVSYLIITPTVLAQTDKASLMPAEKRQQIRTQVEATKQEQRTERIQNLTAIRKERIMSYSNKLTVRLDALVTRLKLLIERIETRIAKIEASDEEIVLTDTKETLTQAKELLAAIESEIMLLKDNLQLLPESEDPKQIFEDVRTSIMGLKDDLKEVHQLLVKVIGDIKGLRVGQDNQNEE